MAFSPTFEQDRFVFGMSCSLSGRGFHFFFKNETVYYTRLSDTRNRISRFEEVNGTLQREELVFWLPASTAFNHNGGRLAFGPSDRLLYAAVGDWGNMAAQAQSLSSPLGKILRFDVSSLPAVPTVLAFGLRNPFWIGFDESGGLLVHDVGQYTTEEISLVPAPFSSVPVNLGWPLAEGADNCINSTMLCPFFTYSHSVGCAITGGATLSSAAASPLAGMHFYR